MRYRKIARRKFFIKLCALYQSDRSRSANEAMSKRPLIN